MNQTGNWLWLEETVLSLPGVEQDYKEEWGWDRYLVGGKMFGAVCRPGPEHKLYHGHPLLTLKCEPMLAELLRSQYPDILPGFYMDKRNWISIFMDGAVPEEVLRGLCQQSYQLVFAKLTKKLQKEILGRPTAGRAGPPPAKAGG